MEKPSLVVPIFVFLSTYFIGILLFHNLEGWGYLDSAYFVTYTMTTVGYGDLTPKTEVGKFAAILFMWIGVLVGFYIIYTLLERKEYFIERRVRSILRIARPQFRERPKPPVEE